MSVSPDGRLLLVSDSGNHRVLVCDASDGGVVDVVGSGRSGFRDGRFDSCEFGSPQGLCVHRGASVFVADPENHSVRVADLERKTVETVCGNGKQGKDLEGGAKGKEQAIRLVVGGCFFYISIPTNIDTTRATLMATPLVVISDGVEIWVTLGCSKGSFFALHIQHLLWR